MFPESHALWVSYTLFGLLDGDFCTYTAIEKQLGYINSGFWCKILGTFLGFEVQIFCVGMPNFAWYVPRSWNHFYLKKICFCPKACGLWSMDPTKFWIVFYLRRIWVGYFLWPIGHMMCSSIFVVQCGLVDLLWHFNLVVIFTQYISLSFIFLILTWNIKNTHRKWVCLVSFLVSYFLFYEKIEV